MKKKSQTYATEQKQNDSANKPELLVINRNSFSLTKF